MAQLMEYADYLSKEIGPRPAGTEEEQQAALYITERFQKDSGFSAQIEEFTSSSNIEGISALPGLVIIVVAILGMVFPVLAIPAFILAAAAAALYALEAFGRPIVTRALARGASQNVVAKYQPNPDAAKTARGRSRKIILVAHYDSGKVTPPLVRTVESFKLPIPIGLVCVIAMVAAAFFLLVHVFVNAGIPGVVVNVLTVICLIVCAFPVLRAVLFRAAPYNEGANNNATGTAAIIEVARRISRGSVSEADLANDPASRNVSIHGEEAARQQGLVPEGAQIRYEAEQLVPPSEIGAYDEEERLLAAKAAIAAMTGQPVERRTFGTVATHLVNSRAQGEDPELAVSAHAIQEPAEARADYADIVPSSSPVEEAPVVAAPTAVSSAPEVEPPVSPKPEEAVQSQAEVEGYQNAPSWFIAAQKNAKKPVGETGQIQRSRYAEAIEAAEREAAEREREREEEERMRREAELKARGQAARDAISQSSQPTQQDAPEPAAEAPVGSASELVAGPAEGSAAESVEEPVAEPAVEFEPKPATDDAPVFVPYAEAHQALELQPIGDEPVDDAFSESLGKTTAFDPRQLRPADQGDDSVEGEEQGDADRSPQRRLASLPSLDASPADPRGDEPAGSSVPETTSPSRSGMFRKLRADVPSMSGVIRMRDAGQDVSQPPVQQAARTPIAVPDPAPATPPAQQATAVDDVDYDMNPSEIPGYDDYADNDNRGARVPASSGDDRYDDGRYRDEGRYGDYDEPAPVDMPKSRAGGLLGRFRRKKKDDLEETPQEWLDVDDDFDARTVGRKRGGWESFRDDAYDDYEEDRPHGRRWEGGSYSRVRLGRVDTRSGEEAEADVSSEPLELEEDRQIADEIEQIYHFRNPLYNTEIWFVALGSEGAAHDGAKAFIAEHADELRGSMIIEVESLGAGELSAATAEGRVRRVAASSRVKRYTREATAATGIAPGSVDLTGTDSAASVFQAAGYQSMHLLGVEEGKPALKGSADDIMENVDDLLLDDNVNFLMELLRK